MSLCLVSFLSTACDGEKAKPVVVPSPSENQAVKPDPLAETPFLKDIDAVAAGERFKSQKPLVVIDVRTPEEFAEGHIEGAINIDFKGANFKEELSKLDPKKEYLMHCRSGGRSTAAKPVFTELGFERLYHLDDGFIAWEEAGLPVEK